MQTSSAPRELFGETRLPVRDPGGKTSWRRFRVRALKHEVLALKGELFQILLAATMCQAPCKLLTDDLL